MFTKQHLTWEYAIFSAHIHRYLPHLKWEDHVIIYNKWIAYHQPKPLKYSIEWDVSALDQLYDGDPKIICLYHLGMHGQIPLVLADQGIHFDLLMDTKVFQKNGHEMQVMQDRLRKTGRYYRFLMSDDPKVLLKARSTIREGRHLVLFADGNSGARDSLDRKVQINFLESTIYARKGIALLSYLLQAPVIPVSHYQYENHCDLFTGTPLLKKENESKDDYIKRCMQFLYQFLGDQIRTHSWHWECWSYLHELNCYEVPLSKPGHIGLESDGNIDLMLGNKRGVFNRKHFCYLLE